MSPTCPRCGGQIPNDKTPGAYPGALSRRDNTTEICSKCGVDEAMEDYYEKYHLGKDEPEEK